ncbi:inhibitor of apoptosis protein-like isoform X2 [Mizuhopecten yessoensis]|uniref:Baculoviral IAP repeat-containing protein 7-A n=2 Tax=Mizuhopecten yessoensis TaxID=6573 RepID=A0A210Q6J8_MIZYE|nr:inhibitor of apoptosis protein-like isoform X2 [Mizuhopecten yessoensis]XP_021365895.1 inhibitor of apoptosis protein-like isoform X2 [Mizuhopecten yessoensis]XP_021365896.1 inhibitor of apoptosis protein-like isoform X2 [Mizuhopecten yessoensis]XP_021365897.1 inhibitor of apoptosis protein-like isoform X2 [Mizuhopecten yessoensis]OWF44363.1 Baculoviral IAP repeat-containing protein 7-A [Mizuhopecten yessoensis]
MTFTQSPGCICTEDDIRIHNSRSVEISGQQQRRPTLCRVSTSGQSKLCELVLPKEENKHDNERINRLDQGILELKTELKQICKTVNIPPRNNKIVPKKTVSQRRNRKSIFMVTVTDEKQSLYLEPKTSVRHRKAKKDSGLVKNLKFSLKRAKQWSIIHKGDHVKEMKKRKRTRDRKVKSDVIKSLKGNWKNTNITEKDLDQKGKKKSLHHSKLQSLVRKWHTQPDKLCIYVYPISRSLDPYFQSLENGNTSTTESSMQIEWLRLNSFANSSHSMQVRPIFLARAGFYHSGHADEVTCYSCGLSHRNWRLGDDPYRLHRTLSPNCRHMAGNDDTNIPIPREEASTPNNQTFQVQERAEYSIAGLDSSPLPENPSLPSQETEEFQPNTGIQSAVVQANVTQSSENMFINADRPLPDVRSPDGNIQVNSERQSYRQQLPDYQQRQGCVQNGTAHSNASTTHNQNTQNVPSVENRLNDQTTQGHNGIPRIMHGTSNRPNQTSPNGTVNGTWRQNIQTQRTQQRTDTDVSTSTMKKLAPLGVNFDKPKYPAYAVLPVRMSSYSGWSAPQTPNLMAEAGFVYAGYADYTRCFFCGGGLRNWEEGDDPWIEHARWFPKCAYLRQNKGLEFIQLVHEQLDREEGKATNTNQIKEMSGLLIQDQGQTNDMEAIRSLPAYQSLIENGYHPKMINIAVRNLRKKGEQTIEAIAIVEEIYRLQDTDDHCIDDVINDVDDDNNDNNRPCHNTPHPDVPEPIDQEMKKINDLMEENRSLKRQKLCRICEEEDASIAFLPCAHLVCCQVCSQAVRRCPVCGQIIQGTVKTWLG